MSLSLGSWIRCDNTHIHAANLCLSGNPIPSKDENFANVFGRYFGEFE